MGWGFLKRVLDVIIEQTEGVLITGAAGKKGTIGIYVGANVEVDGKSP